MTNSPQTYSDQHLLNEYYTLLQLIDHEEQQRRNAYNELLWYQSHVQPATEIATAFGINNQLDILHNYDFQLVEINRQQVLKSLSDAGSDASAWGQAKKDNEIKLEEIEEENKKLINELIQKRLKVISSMEEISQKIENLKTQKMLHIVSIVIVAVLATLFWKDLGLTFLATIVYVGTTILAQYILEDGN